MITAKLTLSQVRTIFWGLDALHLEYRKENTGLGLKIKKDIEKTTRTLSKAVFSPTKSKRKKIKTPRSGRGPKRGVES